MDAPRATAGHVCGFHCSTHSIPDGDWLTNALEISADSAIIRPAESARGAARQEDRLQTIQGASQQAAGREVNSFPLRCTVGARVVCRLSQIRRLVLGPAVPGGTCRTCSHAGRTESCKAAANSSRNGQGEVVDIRESNGKRQRSTQAPLPAARRPTVFPGWAGLQQSRKDRTGSGATSRSEVMRASVAK